MARPTRIFVSAGWLAVFLSCWRMAGACAGEMPVAGYLQNTSSDASSVLSGHSGSWLIDPGFVYRLSYNSSGVVFGAAALGGSTPDSLYGSAPFARTEIGYPEFAHLGRWLGANGNASAGFTVGYAWRNVTLESTAFSDSGPSSAAQGVESNSFVLNSRMARLSFKPFPNWTFQLSRGSVSGLDQLVPGDQVRRTAIAATYRRNLSGGGLQTTFAWGRSSRKDREATLGYLLESTYRFSGTHAVFGRIEQVGSDELMRENEALQRQIFKLNRLTIGYFHEVRASESFSFDVGAFANRHLVPSAMTASYGDNPTTYMMFVRLRLK